MAWRHSLTLTELQVGYWRDTPTLWTHTIAVVPDSYVAYNNLGYYFARADDEEYPGSRPKSISKKSLRINATFPDAQNNLGHTLAREGKLQEAIKYYSDALKLNPRFAQVHNNLGLALARVGRIDEAADHFREAIRLRPTYSMPHNNLGKLLAQQRPEPRSPSGIGGSAAAESGERGRARESWRALAEGRRRAKQRSSSF